MNMKKVLKTSGKKDKVRYTVPFFFCYNISIHDSEVRAPVDKEWSIVKTTDQNVKG